MTFKKIFCSFLVFLCAPVYATNQCLQNLNHYVDVNVLALEDCGLTDKDMSTVAAFLEKHPEINWLDVTDNHIGAKGAVVIAQMKTLQTLEMVNNQIGDEGAAALAKSTSLQRMSLSENKITDQGATALASDSILEGLELNHNPITIKGMFALSTLPSIKVLAVDPTGKDSQESYA